MVAEISLLVTLVALVDRIPMPALPPHRGRPKVYSDRLFLKALVIMIIRRLPRVHALLAVLNEPTPEMQRLRILLTENGHYPTRRTWERRLKAIPDTLPAQITCLGQHLLILIHPWQDCGRAVAIDSTPLRAYGGIWHQKHRAADKMLHTLIDREAHWTKSGWHGWVYGWKLHLVTTVAAVWIPLAAELTPANVSDNVQAPTLLNDLPANVRFILGDKKYDDKKLHALCTRQGRWLVTAKYGRYPHKDAGVEVRRMFHQLRSRAVENFYSQFKGIFNCLWQVPTRGLISTRRYALGAIFVYQLALLYRFEAGANLRAGLKPLLQAA